MTRERDHFVYDPYSKKKKNKKHQLHVPTSTFQPPITKFLSLNSTCAPKGCEQTKVCAKKIDKRNNLEIMKLVIE
jgi:hypothetical protein